MNAELAEFFDGLWSDFTRIAPAAASIHAALEARGETVANDHVAFRTFDRGPIRLDLLEQPLLALGYERKAPYRFEQKKLRAFGYVHPDPSAPLVFLSELEVSAFPEWVGEIVDSLVAQVPEDFVSGPEVFWAGRPWAPVSHEVYTQLQEVSEYAAWLAALGLRPNHFTVSLNAVSPELQPVEAMLRFVESRGFSVNESGGRVKGTPGDLLEQGSTMADRVEVPFAEGVRTIPSCYYEFALRHPDARGELYRGFVAASADRIFESTDARPRR